MKGKDTMDDAPQLTDDEIEFLHECTRDGPRTIASPMSDQLERRGLIEFAWEGNVMKGKWRLTHLGWRAFKAADVAPVVHARYTRRRKAQ